MNLISPWITGRKSFRHSSTTFSLKRCSNFESRFSSARMSALLGMFSSSSSTSGSCFRQSELPTTRSANHALKRDILSTGTNLDVVLISSPIQKRSSMLVLFQVSRKNLGEAWFALFKDKGGLLTMLFKVSTLNIYIHGSPLQYLRFVHRTKFTPLHESLPFFATTIALYIVSSKAHLCRSPTTLNLHRDSEGITTTCSNNG